DFAKHGTNERRTRAPEHQHIIQGAHPFAQREINRTRQGTEQLARAANIPANNGKSPESADGNGTTEATHTYSRTTRGTEENITHTRAIPSIAALLSRRLPPRIWRRDDRGSFGSAGRYSQKGSGDADLFRRAGDRRLAE